MPASIIDKIPDIMIALNIRDSEPSFLRYINPKKPVIMLYMQKRTAFRARVNLPFA